MNLANKPNAGGPASEDDGQGQIPPPVQRGPRLHSPHANSADDREQHGVDPANDRQKPASTQLDVPAFERQDARVTEVANFLVSEVMPMLDLHDLRARPDRLIRNPNR